MTDELYRWFEILNRESFDGALPEPIITIQKTRKNIKGYFTLDKVWQTDEDGEPQEDSARYEICMSANWLRLEEGHPVEDLVATLQHELCHYCNAINDIKDTSGKVHNKKFKIMAEAHGLVVERDKSVGWGYTRPTDEFFDFIRDVIKPDESAFRYYRILPQPLSEEKEKKKFVEEKEKEYNETFANPYKAASYGYIDDVIEPRNTRFRVIRAFQSLQTKRVTNPMKKHSNIPL